MGIYQITADSRFLCFQLKSQIIPMKLCPGQPFHVIFINSNIWHRRSIIYQFLLAYFYFYLMVFRFEPSFINPRCIIYAFLFTNKESPPETLLILYNHLFIQFLICKFRSCGLYYVKLWHFIIRDKLNVIKTEYFL